MIGDMTSDAAILSLTTMNESVANTSLAHRERSQCLH